MGSLRSRLGLARRCAEGLRWRLATSVPLLSYLLGAPGLGRGGLAHLRLFPSGARLGPVLRDEALLLLAVTRLTAPRVVVEFGFSRGHSAMNFLAGLPRGARLYSYDIAPESRVTARVAFAGRRDFVFMAKSMDAFAPEDIAGSVDLAFFDGAHDLAINQRTFAALLPALSPEALVAVHDTGPWMRDTMPGALRERAEATPGQWLDREAFAHSPEERRFVNWITTAHPRFHAVHLHGLRRFAHGLTLLQASGPLATPGATA
jgi:predicted O-methyltransferase YrrM